MNAKIVKVIGCFTEWYAPTFKDPYEDNEDYAKFYDQKLLDMQPVIGPDVNGKGEYLTGDLGCLADRLTCDAHPGVNWGKARKECMKAVMLAIKSGKPQTFKFDRMMPIRITPYKRVPKIPEKSYAIYGKFASLVKERVAQI